MAVSAVISSKCLATETFDEPIAVGRRVTKKFKHKQFDITATLDGSTSPAVSLASSFPVTATGATYDIDLTALPRSVPLADGTTTFDATGKKVVYLRIKNRHPTLIVGVYAGTHSLFYHQSENHITLPVRAGGHMEFMFGHTPFETIAAENKIISLFSLDPDTGVNALGIRAEVTILLG